MHENKKENAAPSASFAKRGVADENVVPIFTGTQKTFESDKENIRPSIAGRSQKALKNLLQNPQIVKNQLEHLEENQDDPLEPHYTRFKTIVTLSNEIEMRTCLNETVNAFIDDTRYKNDVRFVKMAVSYAKISTTPKETFIFLFSRDVGRLHALFYTEFSRYLMLTEPSPLSEYLVLLGIERNAAPLAALEEELERIGQRTGRKLVVRVLTPPEKKTLSELCSKNAHWLPLTKKPKRKERSSYSIIQIDGEEIVFEEYRKMKTPVKASDCPTINTKVAMAEVMNMFNASFEDTIVEHEEFDVDGIETRITLPEFVYVVVRKLSSSVFLCTRIASDERFTLSGAQVVVRITKEEYRYVIGTVPMKCSTKYMGVWFTEFEYYETGTVLACIKAFIARYKSLPQCLAAYYACCLADLCLRLRSECISLEKVLVSRVEVDCYDVLYAIAEEGAPLQAFKELCSLCAEKTGCVVDALRLESCKEIQERCFAYLKGYTGYPTLKKLLDEQMIAIYEVL